MLNPATILPKPRLHLSVDPYIQHFRPRVEQLPVTRALSDCTYCVAEAPMSGLAFSSLKEPSLLAFQERRYDANMKNIFRIQNVPSDTQMREILDPLEPDLLRPMFNDVLRELQRGKALEAFHFWEGHCLPVSYTNLTLPTITHG